MANFIKGFMSLEHTVRWLYV